MTRWALVAPLLLLLLLSNHRAAGQASEEPTAVPGQAPDGPPAEDEAEDWGLNSIRGGLESVGGYFDSVLELMGGRDGVCQHRCRHGGSLDEKRSISAFMMSSLVTNVRFSCITGPNRTWIWFLSLLQRSAAEHQRFCDLLTSVIDLPWRSQSIFRLPAPDLVTHRNET